jgi:fibronectin-binding autotransporter adhesin
MRTIRRLVLLAVCLHASLLAADTRTWTGAGGNKLWTNPANWGGTAPSAGDDLVFPGAVHRDAQNDFPAGTGFHSIVILAAPPVGYVITGNRIALGPGGISANGGYDEVSIPVTVGSSQTWNLTVVEKFFMSGAIDLAGSTLTINATTSADGWAYFVGQISGAGALVKTGSGLVNVQGTNTYTGPTTINAGLLNVGIGSPLGVGDGTPANGTIVNDGGMIELGIGLAAPEAITAYGDGDLTPQPTPVQGAVIHSSSTFPGTFTLGAPRVLFMANPHLRFNGKVTGPGAFHMKRDGRYTLVNPANDFTGPVEWDSAATEAQLELGGNQVVRPALSLDLHGLNNIDTGSFANTLRSITGDGIVWVRDGSLTLTQPSTFSGRINSLSYIPGGAVTLDGAGVWIFNGPSSTTHATLTLKNGANLRIDGGAYSGPIVVSHAGSALDLSNAVPVGDVTVSSGTLTTGGGGGTHRGNTQNLAFASGAHFAAAIGTGAADGFTQVQVTGTVALNGATLDVTTPVPPAIGSAATIIDNDGTEPVSGTFAGLPEGATFSAGQRLFRITYAGGTGNDVVLTAAATTQAVPALDARSLLILAALLGAAAMFVIRRH